MTMVMGNRNQLQWDLPALDSYELIRAIYRLDPARVQEHARRVHRAARPAGELVRKPVRNLSLGERMKVRDLRRAAPPTRTCCSWTSRRSAST